MLRCIGSGLGIYLVVYHCFLLYFGHTGVIVVIGNVDGYISSVVKKFITFVKRLFIS